MLNQEYFFLITCDQVHIYDSDDDSVYEVVGNFLEIESLLVRTRIKQLIRSVADRCLSYFFLVSWIAMRGEAFNFRSNQMMKRY